MFSNLDQAYKCDQCENVCDVIFSFDRQVARVHFHENPDWLEIEPVEETSLGTFCCEECRSRALQSVLDREGLVLPEAPPTGERLESCTLCKRLQDTTMFHTYYVFSAAVEEEDGILAVLDSEDVAIVCASCRPIDGSVYELSGPPRPHCMPPAAVLEIFKAML